VGRTHPDIAGFKDGGRGQVPKAVGSLQQQEEIGSDSSP